MDERKNKLLDLCSDLWFDAEEAKTLVRNLNLNIEIVDPNCPNSRTTFLTQAARHANIKMVRLLLENSADPNLVLYADKPLWRENPFWDLQYNDFGETEAENEVGLKMAQLMLEYGANPNITIDEDEDLFSYVCFAVFNDDDTPDLWEYRSRFLILLIAYGGSTSEYSPQIISDFDKSNMEQYRFRCVPCDDGYHRTGEVVDQNCNVVAKVLIRSSIVLRAGPFDAAGRKRGGCSFIARRFWDRQHSIREKGSAEYDGRCPVLGKTDQRIYWQRNFGL
ncbi:MAG: ankyrin repeat domain-containing protein [Ruminococcaceae bacterium]|nr:ankyrin repeat domain-containing protein [Oscillospiraceae bacterium]